MAIIRFQRTAWHEAPSTHTHTHTRAHLAPKTLYVPWLANNAGPLRWAGLGLWPLHEDRPRWGIRTWEGGDWRRRRAGSRKLLVPRERTKYRPGHVSCPWLACTDTRVDTSRGEQRPGNKKRDARGGRPAVGTARAWILVLGWRTKVKELRNNVGTPQVGARGSSPCRPRFDVPDQTNPTSRHVADCDFPFFSP